MQVMPVGSSPGTTSQISPPTILSPVKARLVAIIDVIIAATRAAPHFRPGDARDLALNVGS